MENAAITFGSRDDKKIVEEKPVFAPKFDSDGLIPAMAMDATSKEPLMLAYMNEQSLKMTLELGEAVYYSRSRQEIWHKGLTSGHVQKIREIRTDCDQDALILYVDQIGAGACHTGRSTCFYRSVHLADGQTPAALKFTETDLTFDPASVYGDK
jgi:phosphoribosyl-AMP cyclohydrolase